MKDSNPIYDCSKTSVDVEAFDSYTGRDEFYAVYTIQLGELLDKGVFKWDRPELDWRSAAFDDEQYRRLCDYFIERFYYREISIEPFAEWARTLKRKIIFELMPKYRPLYETVKNGINPLQKEDEYYKNRTIESSYPETLLSGNSDYITDGRDEEFERIKDGSYSENYLTYANDFKGVDELILDELESMFICMYTTNINLTW